MKTATKLMLAVSGIGATLMTFSLLGHKSVHAELTIPAPPAAIWDVLTHAPGYPAWNPVFVEVQGEHIEGNTLTYQMKDQTGKSTEVAATVTRVVPERELNQFGGIRGILTFDHHWYLEPVEGGTKVTQHEDYRGIGVWFWDPSWFELGYARANAGLRERVMSLAASAR